ncbi:hypothetical protein G3I40_00965 [Streptomyces sp. SID14478]|nr:hypothetical protein [Streptomyces sp. SID14478]
MNMQQAAEQADDILDKTFAAVKPPVHWTHSDTTARECDVSRRRAVMTIISKERRGSFLGVVERFWKAQGYKQTSHNSDPEYPATYFQTPSGYQVRLRIGSDGQGFFEVATPCVKHSEVDPPKSKTVGPDYSSGSYVGQEIPAPNVRSDFWSLDKPVPAGGS